jgi:diguanylate cyclase (GGDEF)-like protein
VAALAIILLALAAGHDDTALVAAQLMFIVAGFLALSAAMSFDGKGQVPALFLSGCAALGLLTAMIAVTVPLAWVRVPQLAIVGMLYVSAGASLWVGGADKLRARVPLAAIFLLHGTISFVGFAEGVLQKSLPSGVPTFGNWYGVIHLESMIYFIGSTLFLVALLKERSEVGYKSASLTDPLTGLLNRRAFFDAGDRLLERCRQSRLPCSVIAIDLDRFKAINDTYGHPFGDRVLQAFAALAPKCLRPRDLVGRLGGEEFAVVLPETHLREAGEVGDRLRTAFRAAAATVEDNEVQATLSGGVAVALRDDRTVADVLDRADAALYRAKLNGRDRIELDASSNAIRVVRSIAS